jgi:hypothetical protein
VRHHPIIIDTPTYRTRSTRYTTFYGGYSSRPTIVYQDPISSAFWWWLLDQSIEERALWAFHNKNRIDAARYQALLNSDASLSVRVAELEAQQRARNVNYVPSAFANNTDLIYKDDYVQSVYASRSTSGRLAFWLLGVPMVLLLLLGCFWLLFIKRW